MADPQNSRPTPPEVMARLQEIDRLLRQTHHLGPKAQAAFARLADDLAASPPATADLLESTARVVEALHHEQPEGPLAAARHRLEEAVAEVEARAPQAASFAQRLLQALADLGI